MIEVLRDVIDCNVYFFDEKVGVPAMYWILGVSVVVLVGVYVVLNVVKRK